MLFSVMKRPQCHFKSRIQLLNVTGRHDLCEQNTHGHPPPCLSSNRNQLATISPYPVLRTLTFRLNLASRPRASTRRPRRGGWRPWLPFADTPPPRDGISQNQIRASQRNMPKRPRGTTSPKVGERQSAANVQTAADCADCAVQRTSSVGTEQPGGLDLFPAM